MENVLSGSSAVVLSMIAWFCACTHRVSTGQNAKNTTNDTHVEITYDKPSMVIACSGSVRFLASEAVTHLKYNLLRSFSMLEILHNHGHDAVNNKLSVGRRF
jgi:hypothetical protein